MTTSGHWHTRVRAALSSASQAPDDGVVEELAQHARALYDAARADGCSHEEADVRVDALMDRWAVEAPALRHRNRRPAAVDAPRAVSRASPFAGLWPDIRYAARLLRRQPRYALLVVLTIALGIGATTLLFSVTYGVLMERLPWEGADRMVVVSETRGGNPPRFNSFSNAAYLAWTEQTSTIDAIGAWAPRTATLTGVGDADRVRVTAASASLFRVLGTRPLIGSLFQQKDESTRVVVLSESLWRQRFSADPGVLGRFAHLDGQPHTIVGIVEDAQLYPDRQSRAFVPFPVRPATGNYLSMFQAVARLRPDATASQAAAEGTARGRFAADTGLTTMAIFGSNGPIEIAATPLRDALTGDVRRPLIMLLAAVALLLITATANVASLQLARATTRRREIAIRAALGAGTARVTRQLLVESLLVSIAGGTVGLALAWVLHGFLPSVLPADFPRVDDVRVNAVVVLFAFSMAVVTGIVFGLLPALHVRRLNLVTSLTEDGTAAVGVGARSMTGRARLVIMAGQVSIACVLLIGASLLGRSFIALLQADRGYDPAGVLTARLSLPAPAYPVTRRYEVVSRILDRLASAPGVTAAAFTSEMPLAAGGSTSAFTMPSPRGEGGVVSVQASPRIVSPQYFSAIGMRVVAGRGFADTDTEGAPQVVVVNRAFARRYFGDAAVGARLPMGVGYQQQNTDATIVGVIDDVRYLTGDQASQPEMYYSYRQFAGKLAVPVVTLMLRSSGDPASLAPAVRTAVREADSALVAEGVMTLEDRMLRGLARPRLYAILLGGFAGFALLVAAVGLFGVLSYSIAQRSRELAVRAALGARQRDVVRLLLGQAMAVTCAGIAIGLAASFVVTRSIGALLYGVTPHDLLTFLGVPVILLVVAAVACIAPAWRAATLDPLRALRG